MSEITPLTAAQRQQRSRAKKKGLPDPFAEQELKDKLIVERKEQHDIDLAWAQQQDLIGRYKSECRGCVELLGIFEGNVINKEAADEDEKKEKNKTKLKNWPNPSITKISIRAVEWNGILLEPNCDQEFRKIKEVDEIVSFQRWLDLRDKARKDLLWFGRLLGKGLYHSVHRHVCNQFVQKNFDGLYFEDYNLDDFHDMLRAQKRTVSDVDLTPCREMILLESRGAYKSTIDSIDCVQWLINCPDIRIMIITGVKKLAKKFAKEVKKYFYLPIKGIPTSFHLLFPEYVLSGVDGRSEQPLECPAARLDQPEPNLWVTSIESADVGFHCDLRKADDVVTPKNSADRELREALKFEFDGTDDILDQWGFSDVIGTRYFTDDWYGTRMLPNPETGEVAPYRYSCRGAWTLPAEYEMDYKSGNLSVKDILDKRLGVLTFPAKLSWSELRRTYNKKGERSFKNQQLNEATDPNEDSRYVNEFDIDVLRAHCMPKESAPQEGEIFQTWDISYSDKKTSDFSVGITGRVFMNKNKQPSLCIHEMVFDKWKSSELSFQIIQFFKKWNPKTVLIEKANGADWLYDNIKLTAAKYGVPEVPNHIYLKQVDTSANAKVNRIKSLELLLSENRLYFVNGPWIDEAFKQLTQFNGEKSNASRKDDIPDGMSFLIHFLPRTSLNPKATPEEVEREMEAQREVEMSKQMYQRMFGSSVPQKQNAQPAIASPTSDPRLAALSKILPSGMRL